jgi:hypothetical protein
MSQVTSFDIPGSPLTMAGLATTLENALAALGSQNRGATAPSNPFDGMTWLDTDEAPSVVLNIYNATTGWVDVCTINETTGAVSFPIGTAAIVAAMLASGAVTTDKIAANNVTLSKLARSGSADDLLSSNGAANDASFKSAATLGLAKTADVAATLAAYATLDSPALVGTPTAPTAAAGTNTTQLATTAFVKNQAYATLASPALTGTPTAPTAGAGTNTTQIATTAFVTAAVGSGSYVSQDQNYNNVGSFCFCRTIDTPTEKGPGTTIAGAYIKPVGIRTDVTATSYYNATLSGTWRCLGYSGGTTTWCTLFQRIA